MHFSRSIINKSMQLSWTKMKLSPLESNLSIVVFYTKVLSVSQSHQTWTKEREGKNHKHYI